MVLMGKHIDLSLILPCFNEDAVFEKSVRCILSMLQSSTYSFEIIFVDDGSTDHTKLHIENMCKKHTFCRYIFHAHNQGRGAAVTTGIYKAHGDVVGYIDIDLEVSPVYIPDILALLQDGKADIVIGNRIYRTSIGSIVREILSVGYRKLSDIAITTGGFDTESGYKFFNRKKFLPILKTIKDKRWFWDTESIVRSRRAGLRVIEVPVLFVRRFDKVSSVHIVRDTLEYFRNIWQFRKELSRLP
jgi:glycosyltransferase involved in cell wall biosynthesis